MAWVIARNIECGFNIVTAALNFSRYIEVVVSCFLFHCIESWFVNLLKSNMSGTYQCHCNVHAFLLLLFLRSSISWYSLGLETLFSIFLFGKLLIFVFVLSFLLYLWWSSIKKKGRRIFGCAKWVLGYSNFENLVCMENLNIK